MNLRNILIRFAKVKIFIFLFLSLNLYCAETSRVSFNQQWDLNVTSIISSPDVESWNLYDISTVLMLPMYFSFRHDIKLSNGNLASYSFEKLLKKAYSYNLYKKNIGQLIVPAILLLDIISLVILSLILQNFQPITKLY